MNFAGATKSRVGDQYCSVCAVLPELVEGFVACHEASTSSARTVFEKFGQANGIEWANCCPLVTIDELRLLDFQTNAPTYHAIGVVACGKAARQTD